MPATFDEGISIRHWDYSETSQTVSLFGRTLGLVRGIAKGARRPRGSFDGGIDLLARGRFGAIMKPTVDLATLTEWDLIELYPRLRSDIASNHAAFYMADLVSRLMQPHDPHPRLYDAFARALGVLGAGAAPPEPGTDGKEGGSALLQFQWTLLVETGFQPRLDLPPDQSVVEFAPESGGFAGSQPIEGVRWKVRRTTAECLVRVAEGTQAATAPEVVDRANRLLAAHIRHTIGAEPPTMHLVFKSQR